MALQAQMIRIEIAGEQQFTAAVTRVTQGISDLRPLWGLFRKSFVAAEKSTFASGGGRSGSWPALSPTYAAWKASHYPGKPIMQATGALMGELTGPQTFEASKSAMAIGTTGAAATYGAYHQAGSGRLPQRKVIDIEDLFAETWARDIGAYARSIGELWGRASYV